MLVRCLALAGLLFVATAHGQTRYVSDKLIVELRRGAGTEFAILRNLPAGTQVDVVDQDGASGYSRVRAGETEGFILTRFLTEEPIAKDKLATVERSLANARTRVTELEQQLAATSGQLNSTQSDLQQTRNSHGQVSEELASLRTASANVVEIRDQNESLRQRLVARDREVEQLTIENRSLASRTKQNWFIVGAGVLLGGIVLGLILPSLRRKRRSDW